MENSALAISAPDRPPLKGAPSIDELAAKYRGQDIVMVGNGPTGRRDYTSLGLPLWVVSGGWQWHPGAELCWMMDDLEGPAWDSVKGVHPQSYAKIEHDRSYWEPITRSCPVPIITAVAYPEKFPQTVEFPLEEVLQRVDPRVYLAETVCFAVAWAIHIGVNSISFGGCDYKGARPAERAGLEYWIGRAEEAGIRCKVFPGSNLLQTGPIDGKNRHIPGIYGYRDFMLGPGEGYEFSDFPDGTGLEDETDERTGHEAMDMLLSQTDIHTVLDVGYGPGEDSRHMASAGKRVIGVDPNGVEQLNDQFNGGSATLLRLDYLDSETIFHEEFDAIWCCHVLEHVDDPQALLRKAFRDLREDGLLVLTVPPAQLAVVGGHFSLWTAGLLLYHLVRAGFDCSQAHIKQYGYNLSVRVRKHAIPDDAIPTLPNYPMETLKAYLPAGMKWSNGSFNGNIQNLNW